MLHSNHTIFLDLFLNKFEQTEPVEGENVVILFYYVSFKIKRRRFVLGQSLGDLLILRRVNLKRFFPSLLSIVTFRYPTLSCKHQLSCDGYPLCLFITGG